jgi:RNA polymerase sigma-70 factor, ECF subfamily
LVTCSNLAFGSLLIFSCLHFFHLKSAQKIFIPYFCNLFLKPEFLLDIINHTYYTLDTLSDNALMLQVKEGDLGRMGLLFERHYRQLYGFIFHMTGNREAGEDIVQNVFLRMLTYRKNFAGTGEFKTWMYHLARNVLNDYFKKNKRELHKYPVENFNEKIAGEYFADMDIEKKQELQTLHIAIMNLNEDNRELLLLCRYQELKYHEIAELLGITEGAVKVRVHRALNQLKRYYLKIAD